MRARTWVLFGLVAGCAVASRPRLLQIVHSDSAAVDSGHQPDRWTPPRDTAVPDSRATACGGEEGAIDWTAGFDGYPPATVAWCQRISPDEATTSAPTCTNGDSGLDSGGGGLVPPPCGFFNLVGALSGRAVDAPLLFCDHDPSGGLRLARIAADGRIEEQLLAEGDCVADPASGVLLPSGDGWLATWLTAGTGEDGNLDPGARFVRVAADASAEPPRPTRTGLEGRGSHLHLLSGDPLFAWVRDPVGAVVFAKLSADDLSLVGPSLPFATEVASLAAARTPDGGSLVALCARSGTISLRRVLASGSAEAAARLPLACDPNTRLRLAVDAGGRGALGLDDGVRGSLALLTPEGALISAVDLGEGRRFIEVLPHAGGWLALDSSGLLRSLDASGRERAAVVLPQVSQAPGSLLGLRLGATADTARVVALGQQTVDLGFGHVNTYNTVEVSHVSLESL